ncbi:MAG TPA: MFS transporter [Gemmatimonadaceae bacterium]|nr:MFS transporter [Gemmatimonadaceae bacterium]
MSDSSSASIVATPPADGGAPPATDREMRRVIFASSLGTVFEWYDFYLYGSLAVFFGGLFFPSGNETAALLASLATFGAGFAVRPFGALFFGRLGDRVGRKYTFLVTIVLMGLSTALVGVLPTYQQAGIFAPIALVTLRLLQGLALGGEYGGAATYVAEHAPAGRRGAHTSWIQTTATLGFFLSLAVILVTRASVGEAEFRSWGWRVPFLLSVVLLAVSTYIRLRLRESPVFSELKAQGKTSKTPLRESFARWSNLKIVLIALFGLTAGQGVVWYTGQFYALFFLQSTLKVPYQTAYMLIAVALLIGTPFFLGFGWLSDRIGRKRIMLAGCLLGALTFVPIFRGITHFANPALEAATRAAPVVVHSERADDASAAWLTRRGVPYTRQAEVAGAPLVTVGDARLATLDTLAYATTLGDAGYPTHADPARINTVAVIALLSLLMLYVGMVYGPIAAYLVELFPTRIRYTSMSLPYHLGNGWFGGFLPLIAESRVVRTGDIYAGLHYPIVVALATFVIGAIFLRETRTVDLRDDAA